VFVARRLGLEEPLSSQTSSRSLEDRTEMSCIPCYAIQRKGTYKVLGKTLNYLHLTNLSLFKGFDLGMLVPDYADLTQTILHR